MIKQWSDIIEVDGCWHLPTAVIDYNLLEISELGLPAMFILTTVSYILILDSKHTLLFVIFKN